MTDKPELIKVNDNQKRALAFATVIALIAGFLFLRDYLMLISVAAIVAFLFLPIYSWLQSKGLKQGSASAVTFLITLLFIIIPLIIVVLITISQVTHLVEAARSGALDIDFGALGSSTIDYVNNVLANMGASYRLTEAGVISSLTSAIESVGSTVLNKVATSVTGIFGLITALILYIFVFFSILRNQKSIVETITALNPLGGQITGVYLQRMGAMTKAMVRGQFIIAIIQGLLSAIGLYIAGLGDLFFFFTLVLTVMSVIPLGAGIITMPIGVVMILFGNVWQGIFVIVNHLLVVTNIDNFVRPKLVPKNARLDSALTMLSVFAGLGLFGFVGIVLGPVLMIVIVTTIQMFLEVYRDVDALDHSPVRKTKSIWAYIKGSK